MMGFLLILVTSFFEGQHQGCEYRTAHTHSRASTSERKAEENEQDLQGNL